MADAANTDMLVYLVSEKAGVIPAESASTLGAGDKLTADFQAAKFFEAENFSFGIKLDDGESKDKKKGGKKKVQAFDAKGKPIEDEDKDSSRSFERWRSIIDDQAQPDAGFPRRAGRFQPHPLHRRIIADPVAALLGRAEIIQGGGRQTLPCFPEWFAHRVPAFRVREGVCEIDRMDGWRCSEGKL